MRRLIEKKGQVWIETVIYTLIGLAVIGLVLAAALPKINAKKDEVSINQAIESLGNINSEIYSVQQAVGNRRVVDLKIGKGTVIINLDNNSISWVIGSSFEYSQKGITVPLGGGLTVLTEEANPWKVTLKENYNIDLQYNKQTTGTKELSPASTPYKIFIENEGMNTNGNLVIKITLA